MKAVFTPLRLLMLAGIALLAGLVWQSGLAPLHSFQQAISRLGVGWLLLICALSSANYALRLGRWMCLLRIMSVRLPLKQHVLIYLSGFALTMTPGKAGEIVRGWYYQRLGVSHAKTMTAFLSERLLDLIAVLVLASGLIISFPNYLPIFVIGVALVAALYVILFHLQTLLNWLNRIRIAPGLMTRIQAALKRLLPIQAEFRQCNRLPVLMPMIALSTLSWSLEAFGLVWMCQGLGYPVTAGYLVFVYALSMIAGVVSFLPGGLGGVEGVMIVLLGLKGVAWADAVAMTAVLRLGTLWYATLVGVIITPLARKAIGNPMLNNQSSISLSDPESAHPEKQP